MTEVVLMVPPGGLARYPNLGIGYLAAVLEQRNVGVEVLDCVALNYDHDAALAYLRDRNPHIIGINVYTSTLPQTYRLMQQIRAELPKAVVVLGGAHINAVPSCLSYLGADYAFHGDCEFSFANFCERELERGKNCDNADYPGLIYRRDEQVCINEKPVLDIDQLPVPARYLFPLDRYFSPHSEGGGSRVFSIITSRGCPGKCIFCANPSRIVRYRSTKKVLEEFSLLAKMGADYIEVLDDAFILKKQRVFDICEGIKIRGLKFQWGIQTPLRTLNEDLIMALKSAGCMKISIGVESGVERIRHVINKPIKDEELFAVMNICRKYRMTVLGHYVFGHPTESLEDMRATVRFACQLNTDFAEFNQCVILPGTELMEMAIREGKVRQDHFERFMKNEVGLPLYVSNGVTAADMALIYKKALLTFYLRPRFVLTKLKQISSIKDIKRLVRLAMTFVRVLTRKKGLW